MAPRPRTLSQPPPQELRLDDVAVFALPERAALTSCGGGLLTIDVDLRVDLRLGGGDCHRGCY